MLCGRTPQPQGGSSCRANPPGHSGNHPPRPRGTPDTIAAFVNLFISSNCMEDGVVLIYVV
jgi:hypothetical protein